MICSNETEINSIIKHNRGISKESLIIILLSLQSINIYITELLSAFNLANYISPVIYFAIYLCGAYSYLKTFKYKRNIYIWFAVAIIFWTSILIHGETFQYIFDFSTLSSLILSDGMIMFFVNLPLIMLSLANIDYNKLLKGYVNISYVIIILFIIIFIIKGFVLHIQFDYMNISYGVLPYLAVSIGSFIRKGSLLKTILDIVGSFFILIGGCRGAVLTLAVFCFLIFLSNQKGFNLKKLVFDIVLGLIILVIIFNFDNLINWTASLMDKLGFASRTLNLYLGVGYEKGLFHYNDRNELESSLIKYINYFGYGLWGDRTLIGRYAHNLFIEVFIDFGIVFGIILSTFLIITFLRGFMYVFKTRVYSLNIFLCLSMAFLSCKYMVSDSYLHSSEFWLLLGFVIGIPFFEKNCSEDPDYAD